MSKADNIEIDGVVTEAFPNAMFEVELSNGHKILARCIGQDAHELHPHLPRR